MTIRGGRPYINAILNGHPATLLVDTSAITTLVDGDLLSADPARASISLQIQQLRFPHLSPATAPVRAYTEANLGEPADLIVGADLLSRYPVQFDFPDRTLTIYRDSQSAASAMPKTAITTVMRTIDGRPAVQGTLDGDAGLWFSLATGAPGDISLEPGADGAARLIRQLSLPYDVITPAGTMNGRLVRAKTFVLGGVTFYQPLVGIVNAQRPGSELSGALCADLLSRLDLFVDQSASTVSFVAGPTATSALLYDPSGILLAVRRGAIAIRTVVPGSPAEQARLRRGDEIVSINGLVPATLEFARALLDGNPGSKVLVVYRRWDSTKSTTLVLRVLI